MFRIVNWNVAGAKFLEEKDEEERERIKKEVNLELRRLLDRIKPHVVNLQENVQYQEANTELKEFIDKDTIKGYRFFSFPLIDTNRHAYVSKWKNIVKNWKKEKIYFAQGNAVLYQEDMPNVPIWSLARSASVALEQR